MSDFPSLKPNQINYDFGQFNISELSMTGSGPIRFRHSLYINNYNLSLQYTNLTQSEVQSIRDHYFESATTHDYFEVPAVIWGTASIVPTDSLYRYVAPPEEVQRSIYFDVTVELRVTHGNLLLYILDGGDATVPSETAFTSFALSGYQPFILNGNGANLSSITVTHIFEGRGA